MRKRGGVRVFFSFLRGKKKSGTLSKKGPSKKQGVKRERTNPWMKCMEGRGRMGKSNVL